MRPAHSRRLVARSALGLAAVLALAPGCFNPFSPRIASTRGAPRSAPVPNSPTNLLRLFEWCYANKAIAEYRELFTADYVFYFNPLDSAGIAYGGPGWRREDELISTTHLFVGGSADQPPADRIELNVGVPSISRDPLFAASDPNGRWHKVLLAQINLLIQTPEDAQTVSGALRFYVIRGDSAAIPGDLALQPDSTRWYIRQLDDETLETGDPSAPAGGAARSPASRVRAPAPPARTAPAPKRSLSYLKVVWLGGTALGRTTAPQT